MESFAESVVSILQADKTKTSGDDTQYDGVWSEFAAQIVGEESIFWDVFVEHVESVCETVIETETTTGERLLLAVFTDGWGDWWVEQDDAADWSRFGDERASKWLADAVYERVCRLAEQWAIERKASGDGALDDEDL